MRAIAIHFGILHVLLATCSRAFDLSISSALNVTSPVGVQTDTPDVLVLLCTQSFTGEELVEDILLERLLGEDWDVRITLVDEAGIDWTERAVTTTDVGPISLRDHARAIIVVASTYGDGDSPNHANEFADWLARTTGDAESSGSDTVPEHNGRTIGTFPYAVFGLGDSSYLHYCSFAKFIDRQLSQRDGQRIVPLHLGDARGDQSGEFGKWSEMLVEALRSVLPRRVRLEGETAGVQRQKRIPFSSTGGDWRRSVLHQPGNILATLTGRKHLLPHNSSHEVVHIELTVSTEDCPIELAVGDHVGIYARNSDVMVKKALEWLGVESTATTRIMKRNSTNNWEDTLIAAGEFLSEHVDLAGRASPSVLRALSPFAGTLELRALARDLTFVDTTVHNDRMNHMFDKWIAGRRLTNLDLAIIFDCRPSLQALARALGPLHPRLYSVSTLSRSVTHMVLGLCVSVVHGGLCSNYMATLEVGKGIVLFFRKSDFHFTADEAPTIMVAAGSGIGPYVGFLEEELKRVEQANDSMPMPLRHNRIFFGCRSPSELLYQDRLTLFESLGSRIHYAFSRVFGTQKVHVQDLFRSEVETIWRDVFERNGRVFVCGRLELYGGVKEGLIKAAVEVGNMTESQAHEAVQALENEGRLLTDCWSVDNPTGFDNTDTTEEQERRHVVRRIDRHHCMESRNDQNRSIDVDLSQIPAWPSYLRLVASGEFEHRIAKATNMFSACVACGRFCEVNRLSQNSEDWGECRVGDKAIVYAADAHFGEEDCLKGKHGSGTIFFGACNLKCIYCQNWKLSMMDQGELVDDNRLAEMMLMLQERGCHNINLVSPTHNVLPILRAIFLAAQRGLRLPVVWNTGGYDSVASLRLLEGIIDIYMPDAKYASRTVARKLSKIDNYPEINQAAIKEMHRQVGPLQIDPRTGLAWRGVLVRHLVLPSDYGGTEDVASFLANEVSANTYMHVMDYYRPEHEARTDTKFGLNRKPTKQELIEAHKKARCASLQRLHGDDEKYDCALPIKKVSLEVPVT